jgi:hypothetical protein
MVLPLLGTMAVLVFEGESPEDLCNRRVKLDLMTKTKEKVHGNATQWLSRKRHCY